jgi:hypothetical protein
MAKVIYNWWWFCINGSFQKHLHIPHGRNWKNPPPLPPQHHSRFTIMGSRSSSPDSRNFLHERCLCESGMTQLKIHSWYILVSHFFPAPFFAWCTKQRVDCDLENTCYKTILSFKFLPHYWADFPTGYCHRLRGCNISVKLKWNVEFHNCYPKEISLIRDH